MWVIFPRSFRNLFVWFISGDCNIDSYLHNDSSPFDHVRRSDDDDVGKDGYPTCPPCAKQTAPGNSDARWRHLAPGTSPKLGSGFCMKRAFKMQLRKAYFRSLVHPSWKLWPKPNSANLSHVFCLLNRWSLKLNQGPIFEQNTFSIICLSIKM